MENIVRVKVRHITKLIDRYWKLCMGMIILIQLLLCVFVLAKLGVMHVVDTPSYLEPTYSFLESGQMLSQGEPILFRTPGYIFFLAVVLGITSGSEWAVVCIQIAMWLGATVAIFYVVSRLTGRAYMGILACLLYTANLSAYEFPCSLQTDGFFACLLIFALLCFYRYIESQKFGYMIGTFALLIYALFVRPQLTYFCMILAVVLIICAIIKKVSWKIALLYCSMFLLAYGGWSARNASYYGDWMYSSVQDFNYMYFYAPGVYVLVEDGATTEDAIAYLEDRLADTYPDHEYYGAIELAHAQKEIGSAYMKEHPAEFVQLCFRGLFIEMFGPGISFLDGMLSSAFLKNVLCLFVSGVLLITYVIYAVGFLKNITKQKVIDWIILLSAMYLMASTAMVGYSRFRISFYPLCIVGAFISWRHAKDRNNDSEQSRKRINREKL